MKFHPFSEIFPLMTGAELKDFADDVKERGLREKIMLYQGMIIDGRNRFRACEMTFTKPEFEEFDGDDEAALAFVWSKNFKRRHLTESQRAMAAAKRANLSQGRPKEKAHLCAFNSQAESESTLTQTEAAKDANVSRRLVQQATKVLKDGDKETVEQVESGKTTVGAAEKKVRTKSKKKQTRGADELNDANGDPVPERLRDLFGDPWLAAYLAQVDQWLLEMSNQKWVTQLKGKSQRYAAFLRAGDGLKYLALALENLNLLRESVAAGVPHVICPKCEGVKGGCDDCRKTGWLPEWRAEELHGK